MLVCTFRAEKQAKIAAVDNSFETLALEWHEHKRSNLSQGQGDASGILEYLKKDVFPFIGKRPVAEIKSKEMLDVLRKMEERSFLDKLKNIR